MAMPAQWIQAHANLDHGKAPSYARTLLGSRTRNIGRSRRPRSVPNRRGRQGRPSAPCSRRADFWEQGPIHHRVALLAPRYGAGSPIGVLPHRRSPGSLRTARQAFLPKFAAPACQKLPVLHISPCITLSPAQPGLGHGWFTNNLGFGLTPGTCRTIIDRLCM
jgi:hypothetical protein